MKVEQPGSATENPEREFVKVHQVERSASRRRVGPPSEAVGAKQDPSHTRSDFERDLARTTERVEDETS